MPEYLAPGVYVEETSFRAKSIEGVGTSTTAFAGPTRRGPVKGTPEMITSFGDFERIYGGFDDLSFNGVPVGDRRRINYLAHGVRNYFDNGGARLYVSRVYTPFGPDPGTAESAPLVSAGADREAKFVSRFPGAAGNGKITVRLLPALATQKSLDGAMPGTVLRVGGETVAVAGKLTGVAGPYKVEDGG